MATTCFKKCIASCDERIASLQVKKDKWNSYEKVMSIMEIASVARGETGDVFKNAPQLDHIKNYKNSMELVNVEKLIYISLLNKRKKEIFPLLLAKYDDLLGMTYEIGSNMVINGLMRECEYLDFCKLSLEQRDFIKIMCDADFLD